MRRRDPTKRVFKLSILPVLALTLIISIKDLGCSPRYLNGAQSDSPF